MKVTPLAIPEVLLIELDVFRDERGHFFERFNEERFANYGLPTRFKQDNHMTPGLGGLRVLVVHEWLYTWAGSERALEQILEIFPRADLVVGVMTRRMHGYNAVTRRARETWLGALPGARQHHRWFLPLQALAFRTVDTAGYDLVISSSHAFAKFVRHPPGTMHVCYCYSPPRYIWDLQDVYERGAALPQRLALRLTAPTLRRMDRAAAEGVDHFISISGHVRDRVRRCYGRPSDVVYPPVSRRSLPRAVVNRSAQPFLLSLGRLVPYKRVDLAIAAAEQLRVKLVIAGDGPERARLERLAGPFTEFLGEVDEARAAELLESCAAFVFTGEEDFGIAPVEANAHGKPAVCYARGGALETMVPGVTAILFPRQDVGDVAAAITECLSGTWDPVVMQENAARFSAERFREAFAATVSRVLEDGRPVAAPSALGVPA